jgi:hypothetical protein
MSHFAMSNIKSRNHILWKFVEYLRRYNVGIDSLVDNAFILFLSSKERTIQSAVEFICSIHTRKHLYCVYCSFVEVQTTNLNTN